MINTAIASKSTSNPSDIISLLLFLILVEGSVAVNHVGFIGFGRIRDRL